MANKSNGFLRDVWARLTRQRKQGSNLHITFGVHPDSPRFVQPEIGEESGPVVVYSDGLRQTPANGPQYLMTSAQLAAKTFPGQQNTRFAEGFRFREPNRESNRPRLDKIRSYADLNAAGEAHIFDRAKVDEFYHDLYQQHQNSEQDNLAASGYVRADYLHLNTRLTYDQDEESGSKIDSLLEKRLIDIASKRGDCVFQLMIHTFGKQPSAH